ncbi:MAG: DUF3987 domain-containing protein [Balneolaceae bacterium]|nr:MAG: DUF3987 domain-containing protein [Balneolaceae bacterium]
MSEEILSDLPKPPEHLSDYAVDVWYKTGIQILKNGRLTESTLGNLQEICFWEEQKRQIRENLQGRYTAHQMELGSGNISSVNTSVLLTNFKAVQDEINDLRVMFGLKAELPEHISNTPEIPDEVFEYLPDDLRDCCDLIEDKRSRDTFLVMALPVLAFHIKNVISELSEGLYRTDYISYVVKSGARTDRDARRAADLAEVLRSHVADKSVPSLVQPQVSLKTHPKRIQKELFQNGGTAMIFEEYMNVAVKTASFDITFYADLIEKSSTRQPLSLTLENDQTRIVIPSVSVSLNGTLQEIKTLVEHLGEEHLTHYSFYLYESGDEWQSYRPTRSSRKLNDSIHSLSGKLFLLYETLSGRTGPIQIEPSGEQWEMIDETFAEKMRLIDELDLTQNLQIANERAVANTMKLISIFTVLRTHLEGQIDLRSSEVLTPRDTDVVAALWLTDTFMKHAIRMYQNLPAMRKQNYRGDRFNRFYGTLPALFDTPDAVEVATYLSIPERTANRYLSDLVDKNKLRKLKRGVYKKI